ncbi:MULTISPECIES: hypothetical protein [Shouchella]|uniref:Uncharacterized protein n=2 Tax=Shouchella TaxID=2893057 RepID=A0ABY7W765_9BACI|nr:MULTISPECIES: hypothetical protein [Shouchella]MED4126787.1 hypothetical protein [Shouchella miscanthi]WDF04518.1 hypothetical protein PQ477_03310 [Shouchella hunanensis]GAF22354.1 hypothetical protein JCM19047_2098 [Bacillus sp. JCM 19047]
MKRLYIGYVTLLLALGIVLIAFGVLDSIAPTIVFTLLILGSVLSLLFKPRKAHS